MHSIRLLKLLAETGFGSRRKLAGIIAQGRVEVNGVVVEDFKHPVHPLVDQITVDGKEITVSQHQPLYLMLNKPAGMITTTNDEKGRQNVLDVVPDKYKTSRLYPVGRLDRDSTGLLLLTNDGDLTYRLTHPKFEHEKEYLVEINGTLNANERQILEKGIDLPDGKTAPAEIKVIRKTPPFNYSITIHEGRNHQVRRMFAQLGYEVKALKRIRVGNLYLRKLKEGNVRELTDEEITGLISLNLQKPENR